jgi:hypothetical protein
MIEGEKYITVQTFAAIVGKTTPAIRYLCNGGGLRPMRHKKEGPHTYILYDEAREYPFIPPGITGSPIYHYTPQKVCIAEESEPIEDEDRFPWVKYICRACTFHEDDYECKEHEKSRALFEAQEEGAC